MSDRLKQVWRRVGAALDVVSTLMVIAASRGRPAVRLAFFGRSARLLPTLLRTPLPDPIRLWLRRCPHDRTP